MKTPAAFHAEMIEFVKESKPSTRRLADKKLLLCKKHGVIDTPSNADTLLSADAKDIDFLKKYLHTKPVRTISGVAVVAIMTKPFPCPHGKCTMCPGGLKSFFGDVPQSYTGNEPATMRAIRNGYDAYFQVFNRLEQYVVIGQNPDKIELIIMGGTFPFMPIKYQDEFIYYTFKAMNDFSKLFFKKGELNIKALKEFFDLPGPVGEEERLKMVHSKLALLKEKGKKSLEEEQVENEKTAVRCIGLTIETKPDYAKLVHANQMLRLGCTRVELGVQTVHDPVLKKINRGHTNADSIEAIKVLKDVGLKINFHMMLGLPLTDKKDDIESLRRIIESPDYQPDMLKLYPCMVMPGTNLEEDWKKGLFKPITTMEAADRIVEFKRVVPEYVRIMRVQRDIPTKFSRAGLDKNNLRQIIEVKMKEKGYACKCIRCREIKGKEIIEPKLVVREYPASGGTEYFLSIETKDDKLVGFCRLRLPAQSLRKEITKDSALIRELHVYGSAVAIGKEGDVQHKGFGKKLLAEAERIAKQHGKTKIVVISGVGVRDYYRKLGYRKEGAYMVKKV